MQAHTVPEPPKPPTDSASAGAERFQTGDGVLARAAHGGLAPLGRVDAVLRARSGRQLVVERAFQRGCFTPLAVDQVATTEHDPATALCWHVVDMDAAVVARLPVYRRVLGRLSPVSLQVIPPAPPDDAAAARAIQAALTSNPLIGDAAVDVHVSHGVVVLAGWVQTIGAKVAADQIAHDAPQVWDVKNRLTSDEELAALARQRTIDEPASASRVERITATLGRLTVHLSSGAGSVPPSFGESLRALPGCRDVTIMP